MNDEIEKLVSLPGEDGWQKQTSVCLSGNGFPSPE